MRRKLELENLVFAQSTCQPLGPGAALQPHPAAQIRMLSAQIQGWPGEPDRELSGQGPGPMSKAARRVPATCLAQDGYVT